MTLLDTLESLMIWADLFLTPLDLLLIPFIIPCNIGESIVKNIIKTTHFDLLRIFIF